MKPKRKAAPIRRTKWFVTTTEPILLRGYDKECWLMHDSTIPAKYVNKEVRVRLEYQEIRKEKK